MARAQRSKLAATSKRASGSVSASSLPREPIGQPPRQRPRCAVVPDPGHLMHVQMRRFAGCPI
jgi:hypothetical protein